MGAQSLGNGHANNYITYTELSSLFWPSQSSMYSQPKQWFSTASCTRTDMEGSYLSEPAISTNANRSQESPPSIKNDSALRRNPRRPCPPALSGCLWPLPPKPLPLQVTLTQRVYHPSAVEQRARDRPGRSWTDLSSIHSRPGLRIRPLRDIFGAPKRDLLGNPPGPRPRNSRPGP